MAVDPNFRTLLDMPEMQLGRPPEGVTAPMMREGMKAAAIKLVVPELFRIDELVIAGPGGPLALRVYYPSAQAGLPVTLFYHGGGWVLCDLDSHDHLARSLALASGSVVVSVDYRLAPETRFPGPVEDCYAALQYVVNSAAALGVDANRVAVAGDSAGGNLAIAVALMARDRGGPVLCHQALFYPVTKSGCETGSFTELASGYFLSREIMLWFWECYLASPEDASHPLASPMHAASFAGLPSASIATCEFDPLRDEGEQFGAALRAAGVQAATRRYAGMIHGFATMPHVTPVAEEAIRDLGHGLANAFRQAAASTATGASSMSTTTQEETQMATAQRLYGAALTGDWAAVTERYRDAIATALQESVLPNLKQHVVSSKVTTPQDFQDRLWSYKGAGFGLEPILTQSAWFRPHNRSEDVQGLFMVGASSQPGAGVPSVLMSAKMLQEVVPDVTSFA